MNYHITRLPKSEIEIEVTIPFSEFEPHVKKAAGFLSEETEIEGFRRGKAPYDIVKNRLGEIAIYERAAGVAVESTYRKILGELMEGALRSENAPIGRPEITVTKLAPGNELQYKAKLALLPEVKLPDYKSISPRVGKERKDVEVTDEEIRKTIDWVRESRATGEGDSRKVPELNDDFAKSLGSFSTVEALTSSIRDGLRSEKEEREKQRVRVKTIEEIAKNAQIEIPDILVESELNKMLEELKDGVGGMGMKWEDYMSHIKKTVEDLRKEWREDAEKRVRIALCLREIARIEKIESGEEEIEARANEFLRQYRTTEGAEKSIDPQELREYTKGILRNEKVFEWLENI